MGKGVLNVSYFHDSLSKELKKDLIQAYQEKPTAKYLNELSLADILNIDEWDDDDYENDCRGLPYTCSASEISTPYDREYLAFSILSAAWRRQKYLICNTVSPNDLLSKMGFKLQAMFMGNHKTYVYSYQMRLDNMVV